MHVVWHIPSRGWRAWLEAVASVFPGEVVEVEGDLLLRNPGFRAAIEALGLRAAHMTDLVPASMTRGLFDTSAASRHTLVRELAALLAGAEAAGVRTVDLDLGLESVQPSTADEALAIRRETLIECAQQADGFRTLRVCLPVRIPPPWPGSRLREWTANLFFDAMQPWLQLSFDLFPAEGNGLPEIETFVRDTSLHAGVYRFHWHPDRGEVLSRQQVSVFAACLQRRSWRGPLVLRPALRQTPDQPALVRFIERIAGMLSP